MTNGKWVKEGTPWEGWLPTPTTFEAIDPDLVPRASLLREFIGGGSYKYH